MMMMFPPSSVANSNDQPHHPSPSIITLHDLTPIPYKDNKSKAVGVALGVTFPLLIIMAGVGFWWHTRKNDGGVYAGGRGGRGARAGAAARRQPGNRARGNNANRGGGGGETRLDISNGTRGRGRGRDTQADGYDDGRAGGGGAADSDSDSSIDYENTKDGKTPNLEISNDNDIDIVPEWQEGDEYEQPAPNQLDAYYKLKENPTQCQWESAGGKGCIKVRCYAMPL